MTRPPSAWMERALSRWAGLVIRHSGGILAAAAVLTVGLGVYTARNLGVDTSTEGMVSDDLAFRRTYLALQAAFPRERDQLLILVEGMQSEFLQRHRAAIGPISPPVGQGDVYRAATRYRPRAIGIVDGYFHQVPSVWHKEILWAMAEGIHDLLIDNGAF